MRERTFAAKKATPSTFAHSSLVSPTTTKLANPVRGFGLPTNNVIQTAADVSTELQEIQSNDEQSSEQEAFKEKPISHDISRIPVRHPQAKLTVGEVGDKYEQEADMMAHQVMSMPAPTVQRQKSLEEVPNTSPVVQREAISEEEDKIKPKPLNTSIQRQILQRASNSSLEAGDSIESQLNSSKGGGSPLSSEVRSFMEPRFGFDFSQVRVHTNREAVQMNRDLSAQAFTHGSDVYFGEGKAPGNNELTAHELTHVVQQNTSRQVLQRDDLDPETDQQVEEAFVEHQGQSGIPVPHPMYPPHARGHIGEQTMGFAYSRENGWIFIEGPSGAGGHGVTQPGLDGVAYNTRTRELHILDNKAISTSRSISSASAITRNLENNISRLIGQVEGMSAQELRNRQDILRLLRQTRASISSGSSPPGRVRIIVSNAAGLAQGVTDTLRRQGIEFVDLVAPHVGPRDLRGGHPEAHRPQRVIVGVAAIASLLSLFYETQVYAEMVATARAARHNRRSRRRSVIPINPDSVDLYNIESKIRRVFELHPLEVDTNLAGQLFRAVRHWKEREYVRGNGSWHRWFEQRFSEGVRNNDTDILGVELINWVDGAGMQIGRIAGIDIGNTMRGNTQYIEDARELVISLLSEQSGYAAKAELAERLSEFTAQQLEEAGSQYAISPEDMQLIYDEARRPRYAFRGYVNNLNFILDALNLAYGVERHRFERLEQATSRAYENRGE
ncbi:DUF4157 domain-containing protein [Tolypothrix sp. FACHB-123]|uniref:eCIS core domain-containing protein n=1 Tax=Tolypothrix sp. FACHB-123 TaxID=2692868 RepID=UPI001685DC07|nr:DUF4157 domain-containing protein [Tolypothrix sp. FACHB-123]MBD2357971.1 DUF4157 domain-containing protein [Tolypothrix sp. FACHB-123]